MTLPENEAQIAERDPRDMYHKIIHLPEQVLRGYFEAKLHVPEKFVATKPGRLVLCGMGGSAIAGDIVRAAYGNLLPIEVVKDYHIPCITPDTLVIVSSYSGATEESLSCQEQALAAQARIAAVTSGGPLQTRIEGKFPWVELPGGFPPRSAVGYLFFGVLRLLELYDVVPSREDVVKRIVASLIMKAGAIAAAVPDERNLAKQAAIELVGKIPVIYAACPALEPLAYRWKCQINENAKSPAFSHVLPEMCHNEIQGWEAAGFRPNQKMIFLAPLNLEPRYERRVQALKKVFEAEGIDWLEFYAEGDEVEEQVFGLLYLGDMISYYLALLRGVDPTAIRLIETLKSHLQ
jgi:glucose/mannose-6-phosphate isomerase